MEVGGQGGPLLLAYPEHPLRIDAGEQPTQRRSKDHTDAGEGDGDGAHRPADVAEAPGAVGERGDAGDRQDRPNRPSHQGSRRKSVEHANGTLRWGGRSPDDDDGNGNDRRRHHHLVARPQAHLPRGEKQCQCRHGDGDVAARRRSSDRRHTFGRVARIGQRHPGGVQGDTDSPGQRQQTHGSAQQRGVDAPSASESTDDAEEDAVGTALRPWRVNEPWCRGRGCAGRVGLSHVVNRRAAPPPWVLVVSRISRGGIRGITDGHRGDLSLR